MTNESARLGILERGPGEEKDRELSWLDYSLVTDISRRPEDPHHGVGEGGGPGYSAYLRKTDGSPAIRLGAGSTEAFSPDGAWAISITAQETPQIVLLPTSVGEPKALSREGRIRSAPTSCRTARRIVYTATQSGQGTRLYLRGRRRRKSRALTPEGYSMFRGAITPDEKSVVVRGPDRRITVSAGRRRAAGASGARGGTIGPAILGGREVALRPGRPDDSVASRSLRHGDRKGGALEGADGRRRGGSDCDQPLRRHAGRKTYAYSYLRILSYLQLVDGLK